MKGCAFHMKVFCRRPDVGPGNSERPRPEKTSITRRKKFDLGGLQMELEQLLGVSVDVKTPRDLPARFRDQVVNEALPV